MQFITLLMSKEGSMRVNCKCIALQCALACYLFIILLLSVNSAHNIEVINSIVSSIGTDCFEEDLIRSSTDCNVLYNFITSCVTFNRGL